MTGRQYELYNLNSEESHGIFESFDAAKDAAYYDGLTDYEIRRDGEAVYTVHDGEEQ